MNTKWFYVVLCVLCIAIGFTLNSQRHTITRLKDDVRVCRHDSDITYGRLAKSDRILRVVVRTCHETYDLDKCGKMMDEANAYVEEHKNEGR